MVCACPVHAHSHAPLAAPPPVRGPSPLGRTPIARARLTIDLDAIAANWRALDARSAPAVETAAVVKANAYGLGLAPVARTLHAAGARSFFVALAEEGAALRAALGPGPAIHVFSGLMPGDAALVREHMLIPCLNSAEQIAAFLDELPGHPSALQLDTGMNRLGLEAIDLPALLPRLAALAPRLVMSHLACADEAAHPMNPAQLAAFTAMRAVAPFARASLAATGGILLGPAFHHALTRPGIGLYGGLPFAEARPVVTLSLPVIQTRPLAPGEAVGYGATWTAPRASRIATVAAGYADGLIRRIGEGYAALYAGATRCPIVGRVSMDLIGVDVSELANVPASLDILGEHQTVDALAAAAGTIGYEILTALGDRYERVYRGGPGGEAPPPQPSRE
jgi:alanine racemase